MSRRPHAAPLVASALIAVTALALIAYILWPTWQGGPGGDPDRLPVTVGSTLFNVPPRAIRVRVQRHTGPQERVDLVFLYPGLGETERPARASAATLDEQPTAIDRIFVTLAAHNGALSPEDRLATIYPRYLEAQGTRAPDGLTATAFRDGTPYRNEDLFSAAAPSFAARCSRDAATPGMCLSERRIAGADVTFRFPRAWLADWRDLAANLERLVGLIGPRGQ